MSELTGRRVRVWLEGGYRCEGIVEWVRHNQVFLGNIGGISYTDSNESVRGILIDTSSGSFHRLEFIQPSGEVRRELSQMLDFKLAQGILANASEFRKLNPEADLREFSLHVERTLTDLIDSESGIAEKAAARDLRALPDDFNRLNPDEKALYRQYPGAGVAALAAAKIAEDKSNAWYEPSCLEDGNGDAFRHAFWNCLMNKSIGSDMAKRWGDAHESGVPNNPPLKEAMDLFNNRIGRGISITSTVGDEAPNKVREAVREGRLRRIINGRLVATDGTCEK